jgi:transcriptional regulator with XRE-family HTH domain
MVMSRLRDLRKAKGYTQIKIQMLTGIEQSDYSKLESGRRHLTFEQCKRLARALDTSMDYLAEITDNPLPYRSRETK